MSLLPFKDQDNTAIFILFPLLIHCLKYPSQQNGLAFSAPQNLIRKRSVCRRCRELDWPCFVRESEVQDQRIRQQNQYICSIFAMLLRSLESFKARRKFAIYFWYYHCVVCFLWKVTSALHFAFSQCLKGQYLHLLLSIYGMTEGSPLKQFAKLFLKVTKNLLSLLKFLL